MATYLIPVLLVITVACKNSSHSRLDESEEGGTITPMDFSLLQGTWWSEGNPTHALFYISGDSLYYTEEQNSPYLLRVEGDSLILLKEKFRSRFLVEKLTNDSLILYDFTIEERARLFKKH